MNEKLHRIGVFVAGNPKTHGEKIRAFMNWIEAHSGQFYLTYDWLTAFENRSKEPVGVDEEADARRWAAVFDADGVRAAQVLVLFDAEFSPGAMTELGIAIGSGRRSIVIDPHYLQVYYYHPNVFVTENEEQAKDRLADLYTVLTFAIE